MKPRLATVTRHLQRGVSLVEAMAALAVMAFGLLGVVGLQSTLRANSDIAKQRSEAVRRIQEVVEQRRGFSTVPTTPGVVSYQDLITQPDVDQIGVNATFTISETVVDAPDNLPFKTLRVAATWADRASQPQTASVTTTVMRAGPELSAALVTPAGGGAVQLPAGRSPVIPRDATNLGNGTSSFAPPGAGAGVAWIFNNATGHITQYCNPTCNPVDQRLLSGFIRFATGPVQPTAADAENPTSSAVLLNVWVNRGQMAPTQGVTLGVDRIECFERIPGGANYVEYFCPVPASGSPASWSGWSELAGLTWASSISSPSSTDHRVCRYTPVDAHTTTSNTDHPLDYSNVENGLTNQNFLVIRAGDGTSAFGCPDDNPSTPAVNTNTFHHQPSS